MVYLRQSIRALVMVALVVAARPVRAHHGPAAPAMEPAVGLLPQTGATTQPRSRVSVVTRYLRLPDQTPSYTMPIARAGDHVGVLEVGYTQAFSERATMTMALPLLLRAPEDVPSEDPRVGIGDLRLGTRVYPWLGEQGSLSLALDLSLPTAGLRRDDADIAFGTGDFIPRAAWLFTHALGEGWARFGVSAEGGVSGALRPDGNTVLDHGLAASWTPLSMFALFVGARARTFLRDDEAGLAALRAFPRMAGDTLVTISPGIRFFPIPDVVLTAGPRLPLTTARDDEGSVTLRLDVLL